MANEPGHRNQLGAVAPLDFGLVTLSGVALVNADPEPALEAARGIGDEFPGGCPCLFVVDCERMTEGQLAFAMGWYLGDASRGRVSGSLVLLREVQCLSRANQALFAHLIAARRRGDEAVRIVASSSVDLYQWVCDGRFDAGLYYLLNVVTLSPRRGIRTHTRPAIPTPDTEGDSTGSPQ